MLATTPAPVTTTRRVTRRDHRASRWWGAPEGAAGRLGSLRLDDLLDALSPTVVHRLRPGVDVADVAYDSRRVRAGTLFVCVRGAVSDGHDHAAAAVAAGAVALVVERELDARRAAGRGAGRAPGHGAPRGPLLRRPDARAPGDRRHGHQRQDHHRLPDRARSSRRPGSRPGCWAPSSSASAASSSPSSARRPRPSTCSARSAACSTRATAPPPSRSPRTRSAYGRADGVRFAAAAFTNLTQDHLDFHGDMEAYFAAKALLFDGRCPRATNADDPYGRRLPAELRYAVDDATADVRAEGLRAGAPAARASASSRPQGARDVAIRLPGRFNVANALAAASAALLADVRARRRRRRPRRGARRARPHGAGRGGPALRGAGRLRPHARTPWPTCCAPRAT